MSGITRRTSSNMTLIVSTVEYWAAIWLSMCSDLSRISPILSVLMMEWCLVKSLCSSWTWSFRFCISVCRDYKHTDMHIYRATCKNFPSKWWVYKMPVKCSWAWKTCCSLHKLKMISWWNLCCCVSLLYFVGSSCTVAYLSISVHPNSGDL